MVGWNSFQESMLDQVLCSYERFRMKSCPDMLFIPPSSNYKRDRAYYMIQSVRSSTDVSYNVIKHLKILLKRAGDESCYFSQLFIRL